VSYDSSCDLKQDLRGQCTACQRETMCCNEATVNATTGGLCSELESVLATCTVDNSMWATLMSIMLPQYVGPNAPGYVSSSPRITFGNNYSECKANIDTMCREASPLGTARASPLLCSLPFMCAKRSPLMSAQVNSQGMCGLQGATCPKRGTPKNVICCTYLNHVVNSSCSGLNDEQISGLATSKLTECSSTHDCIMPPFFQYNRAHLAASSKQPESLHMATSTVVRQSMYMLGGYSAVGKYLDTFWRLDVSQYPPKWWDMSSLRGAPTGGRRGAAMASVQATLIMTGGEGPKYLLDDAFMFDTDTGIWTDITFSAEGSKPSARYQHAMVGVGGSKAYLFGGETNAGKTNDLYGEGFVP
jgi:hypothetical protein